MLLSIEQRLNLLVLVGSLECKTIAEMRAAWGLLDRLELSPEEKQAIELQVNGQSFHWKPEGAAAAREFELSEAEAGEIRRAIEAHPQWIAGVARNWLRPLLDEIEVIAPQSSIP